MSAQIQILLQQLDKLRSQQRSSRDAHPPFGIGAEALGLVDEAASRQEHLSKGANNACTQCAQLRAELEQSRSDVTSLEQRLQSSQTVFRQQLKKLGHRILADLTPQGRAIPQVRCLKHLLQMNSKGAAQPEASPQQRGNRLVCV